MNVLSLFDGMGCGRLALDRAGIKVSNYFASEIDKYAVRVAQYNYPDIVQLGDVAVLEVQDLPEIDLLIGGSPCTGFSQAGKGLNFDDPQSKLFFEYVRILKEINPKYFLLENVKMKKEYRDIISSYLGVEPVEINSALVSAQNRKRLYWLGQIDKRVFRLCEYKITPVFIEQPRDKGILLKDILEYGEVDREKSYCIDANYFKGGSVKNYMEKKRRQIDNLPLYQSERRLIVKGKKVSSKDNVCVQIGEANIKGMDIIKRVYSPEGKAPTLSTMQGGHREPKVSEDTVTWRKLTPIECERLQTVPDNFTLVPHPKFKDKMMSNTQRYKMLGNGWTVDVIAHIFKSFKENLE